MKLTILKIVRIFHLINKKKYNLLRQIDFIKKSEIFDETYYFKQNPQLKKSDLDPIEHYVKLGWKIGCNPNKNFDNDGYLALYPELYEKNLSPLFHYIRENPSVLPKFTLKKYFMNLKNKLVNKDDIKENSKKKLSNYELIEKSEYFDKKWYLKAYPEVAKGNIDPIEHYLTTGWKKGYNPSKKFDGNAYLENYQDVKKAEKNPLLHYLQYGINGKYKRQVFPQLTLWEKIFNPHKNKSLNYQLIEKSKYFDVKWYLKQYPDVKESGLDPIEHYLTIGWKKGFNPNKKFNGNAYIERYIDVAEANVNPLLHYIRYGAKENRDIFRANEKYLEQGPNKWDKFICKNKSKNTFISIIVVNYNSANLIIKTLDSLVAQTYKNFEIIVIDDGSTDNSIKIIKKYVKQYPFIQLHRHNRGKKRGVPETVKLGIEKSKGKYIAFCESGNYWTQNHLEEKIKVINSYANPKIIVNDVELVGDTQKRQLMQKIIDECKYHLNKTKNKISVEAFRNQNWIVTLSCCMIKKSVLNKCDIVGTPIEENLDWWLYRQICCENIVFYINQKLTYWNTCRLHTNTEIKDIVVTMMKQELFIKNMDKILLKKHPLQALTLLKYLEKENNECKVNKGKIYHHREISQYQPAFSIIMPTFNRAFLLESSIDSVLKQTYRNFELILVDDGSTDGTEEFIQKRYAAELKSGKIKYIYKENSGVCKTRNIGLKHVSNEWIAYCDSDNFMAPHCLERFASAILEHPQHKTFYANLIHIRSRREVGQKFDYSQLLERNYIDLGVFCHHRTVYEKLGGFDENMTRLVDWDLIVRYTWEYKPYYVNKTVLYYNDADDYSRITNSAKLYDNMAYFRKKNCDYPTITTMITAYNHQDYIKEAIESAIKQKGKFTHEIIISDDGSTDKTPQIIVEYAEQYPHLIRNISSSKNIGISANMKKCFEAASGKYIAVLEGDDYWTDTQKLEKQMQFLEKNKDCSMVFSRVRVYNEDSKKSFLLEKHDKLPNKLTGKHFVKEMSLIVNFSCTMYRRECLLDLPEVLYEGRLSEIALAMYLENKGKIGFISTPLSVYRQNSGGVWSGSDKKKQLQQGLISRKTTLEVCASKYKKSIQKIIEEQYEKPLKNMEETDKKNNIAV